MRKSTFKLENKLISEGYDFVIGVDEAGRGPLAGPVVACAVVFKSGSSTPIMGVELPKKFELVRDSKTLSEKQREELYDFICEHFYVGIGICDHKTIDRINILEATYLAMKKAISALTRNVERITPDIKRGTWNVERKNAMRYALRDMRTVVLVDGNKKIPNLSIEQKAIIGGDNLVKSISAASIIAKVTRDRIMRQMHEKYPEYCFNRHKGYGTKKHIEMIKKHGACEIHRYSFEPVRNWTKKIKTDKIKLANKP